ncbi:MAG: TrbC/VirB2 family protein [Vulcanimicrobiaceae bacterium]
MKTRLNYRNLVSASIPVLSSVLVLAISSAAMASTTGGGGSTGGGTLPWDGPLGQLSGFLTGSVAKYISIIAIFVAGLALVFGEDLGAFAKRLLMIVIAIAFLVGAGSFASTFIGTASGAVL